MNVRDFCQEPGYRSALILTWSFDAVFFERVVLPDLRLGGAGVVAVLADRREVDAAIHRWPGLAQHLGRRYVLDTAGLAGHFHPKVILRTGPSGAMVWVGTGNVTPAGWGGNRELATAWKLGPGHPDEGPWVAPLLDQVLQWTGSASARDALARIRDEPWIGAVLPREHGFIWTAANETLAAQLERRWAGRRFTRVRLTTGSTDQAGAFLSWCHRAFGVEAATIAVHAEYAAFDAGALERLPMALEFIEPSGHKPLHAKCYWFEGPGGSAAVMGSANCSASGWVRSPAHGGNVEAAVVFDTAEREAWGEVLAAFEGPRVSIREHLRERPDRGETEPPPGTRYRVLSASLDVESGLVEVEIDPQPSTAARLTLLVGREELPLSARRTSSGWSWEGPRPEASATARPLFAVVRIVEEIGVTLTAPRWIDQRRELEDSARDHRVSAAIGRLGIPLDTSEQRRIVEDLQLAMDAVLTDRAGFPDLPARRMRPRPGDADEGPTARLDPRRMAVALREVAGSAGGPGEAAASVPLSLTGVLRALFTTEREDMGSEDADVDLGSDEGEAANELIVPPVPVRSRPPDKLRKRLAKQMEHFLARLRERAFADTCTATQLVQATALPIAVATLGQGSGWVEPAAAQGWTTSAVIALLHERIDGAGCEGLLDHVGRRYKAAGRVVVFNDVVGDGLLWAVAATALVGFEWEGLGGRIRRALLLRDLFKREELSAGADPAELYALAARFRHGDAVASVTSELPHAEVALDNLEQWLARSFEGLVRSETATGGAHAVGDPLWRSEVGWVFVAEPAPITAASKVVVEPWRPGQFSAGSGLRKVMATGFYVNVRLALLTAPPTAPPPP